MNRPLEKEDFIKVIQDVYNTFNVKYEDGFPAIIDNKLEDFIEEFNNTNSPVKELEFLMGYLLIIGYSSGIPALSIGNLRIDDQTLLSLLKKTIDMYLFGLLENIKDDLSQIKDQMELENYLFEVESLLDGYQRIAEMNEITAVIPNMQYQKLFDRLEETADHYRNNMEKFDDRIDGKLSNEEVEDYWMQLSKSTDAKGPVLSKQQVNHLLHANFKRFYPRKAIIKFNISNMTATDLKRFTHAFYSVHKIRSSKLLVYAKFLKNNFICFEDSGVDTIYRTISV